MDQAFDVGNLCLLNPLGFTAAELSQMGSARLGPTARFRPTSVTSQPTLSRGSTMLRRSLQPAERESPGTGHAWWD